MTPRQEGNIERSVGRIEAQNEAMAEKITKLVDQFAAFHEAAQEMKADIVELKRRADLWAAVTVKFDALDRAIQDGKLQGVAFSKGAMAGFGLACGTAGAFGVKGLQWVWTAVMGT